MEKERLDLLLLKRGLFPTREKAKAAIMAGHILVDGRKLDKAGTLIPVQAEIKLSAELPFVSRGGLKLKKALDIFTINLKDKVVLDVGASTGGFTHCALLYGARKVYAVDVGYGQLAWELRQDPRVVVMERINARYLTPQQLGETADVSTIDVSFISLGKIFPAVKSCLHAQGEVIALVKPQFEAGREFVGKKGVVRNPEIQQKVIVQVLAEARNNQLSCAGLSFSPLTGPEGNIEYLVWLKCQPQQIELVDEAVICHTVSAAHQYFKNSV